MQEDLPRPMGRLGSTFGIKGYIKVESFTSRPDNLFDYSPWYIRQRGAEWREVQVEDWHPHGKGFVAKLNVASVREEASAFTGMEIGIRRSSLPPLADGEYYLMDLEGCQVIGIDGVMLGVVSGIRDQGAAPLLEVSPSDHLTKGKASQRLIPFVVGPIITSVDLTARVIRAEWGEDY